MSKETLLAVFFMFTFFSSVSTQMKECQQESSMINSSILRLKKDLLCGYDKTVRPVIHHLNKTTVYISLTPVYFYMDERFHTLAISCSLGMKWTDEFLKWNPTNYDSLNDFFFESVTIWIPGITTTTNPSKITGSAVEVGVSSKGEAYLLQDQYFRTYCELDHTNWPYDSQTCSLSLRTTSYYWPYLDLQIVKNSEEELKKLYNMKAPWILNSMTSVRHSSQLYQYQDLYAVAVTFSFYLQRHASFYNSAIVTTAIVLPLLVLCIFWMDPRSSSRINLCVIILICHVFYFQQMTASINSGSDSKPKIVTYCEGCVFLAALCLVSTIASQVISELSTGPYVLHQLSSWICSNRYAQFLLLIEVGVKDDSMEGSEDESSLISRNRRFLQQWKVFAVFIDRILFIVYLICYIYLYARYIPG
ncbi:neuronal acetylcholine receptor subunit alpha-5-like [Lycorma delicatula]|uniref:neuronal acetylcholine receptor subunit alpha-5-like n=1 Tax=Lycorma delicatula TaxID=130591 RepID=UPI003F5107F0